MTCQVESPKPPSHTDHYSCCYRVPCALGLHVQTLSVGHKPGWGRRTNSKNLLLERKTFCTVLTAILSVKLGKIYRAG